MGGWGQAGLTNKSFVFVPTILIEVVKFPVVQFTWVPFPNNDPSNDIHFHSGLAFSKLQTQLHGKLRHRW